MPSNVSFYITNMSTDDFIHGILTVLVTIKLYILVENVPRNKQMPSVFKKTLTKIIIIIVRIP